ncbi:MAG: hypothetical protein WAL72_00310 [Streptosporangiaceae bacterium]
MSTANRTVPVDGIGPVEVTIAEYGSGQPFLLLHGDHVRLLPGMQGDQVDERRPGRQGGGSRRLP